MGTVVLGVDLNYVKPGDDFGNDPKHEKSSFLERGCSFHEAYDIFFAPSPMGRILLFANGFIPVRWIPIEANREFHFVMDWLNSVLRNIIRDRYRSVSEAKMAGTYETSRSRDLVTFIVEEIPRENMGENEFLGHLLEIMAAGHDTSANMLSWSCSIMANQQDIQERLRQEICTLEADAPFAELDKLPYLDGFVKESLRAYPPGTIRAQDVHHDQHTN